MENTMIANSLIPVQRSSLSAWFLSFTEKGRKKLEEEYRHNKNVARQQHMANVIEALPYMDPDSTRFVEYLWMLRQQLTLDTEGAYFDISADLCVEFSTITDIFRPFFECVYNSDHLFRGLEFDEDAVPDLYIVADCTTEGRISINMFGDPERVKAMKKHFEDNYQPPRTITIQTLNGFTAQGADVSQDTVFEDNADMCHDSFYPWIEGGVDKLIEEYKNSKSSVLVLIGPPGTGKTTFLRTLMFRLGRENIGQCHNKVALENPGLIGWVRSIGKDATIGIEDADSIVRRRREGNDQMSSLLSYADGVVKHNNKLIIATNLENTDVVDEALIRPGRAFRVIVFRKLRGEEINAVRKTLGKSDIDTDQPLTLSEVINQEDMEHLARAKESENGFGFTSRKSA